MTGLRRVTKVIRVLLPVLVLALTALPATAQQFSDAYIFIDPDGVETPVGVTEQQEQPGTFFVIIGDIGGIPLPDPTQVGNPTGLLEPGTKRFSDIFGVVQLPDGRILLAFGSDTKDAEAVFPDPPTMMMNEDAPDGRYDATMYLNPVLVAMGWRLIYFSDPD